MKDIEALKEFINTQVRLQDFLVRDERISGELAEEQMHCPFHGPDNKKSARYYRETDTLYCWSCHKKWDLFSYIGQKQGIKYGETFNHLINSFNLDVSSVPDAADNLGAVRLYGHEKDVDNKGIYLIRLKEYLIQLRGILDIQKFAKLVFSYQCLKYVLVDKAFEETAEKMTNALKKIAVEINA